MAFTERFVTSAAAGGGDGSQGNPWTLAEALTQAVATDRVNVQSDAGYSLGADTVSNAGTNVDVIVFRGYDSTIGDLENPGRSATTGKLVVTGFPVITLTGALTPNAFVIFQNLAITGAINSALISSTAIDFVSIIECELINTNNASLSRAVELDNNCNIVGSDLECTGAAHGPVLDADVATFVYSCRIKSVEDRGVSLLGGGFVFNSSFIGNGVSQAIDINGTINSSRTAIAGNTIFNWATAIQFPNNAPAGSAQPPFIINNHVTDCAKYIDNLFSATDAIPMVEMNNRTRDNTSPRTGVGDGVNSGEVTTDTGGIETDYVDANNDDLNLISGAPGIDTGQGLGG